MKAKTLLTCVLCGLVLGFTTVAGADGNIVDNPQYQQWAKYKPGTYLVTKTNSHINSIDTTTICTTTLKEVTKEKVVLSMEFSVEIGGNKQNHPPQKLEIPAKIKKAQVTEFEKAAAKPNAKKGKETLEIGGRKVETEWIEVVIEVRGVKSRTKKWQSDEVPGKIVKMETEQMTKPPAKTRMIVAKFEIKK